MRGFPSVGVTCGAHVAVGRALTVKRLHHYIDIQLFKMIH